MYLNHLSVVCLRMDCGVLKLVVCESVLIVCCWSVHGLRRSAAAVCDCTIIFRLLRKAAECID